MKYPRGKDYKTAHSWQLALRRWRVYTEKRLIKWWVNGGSN